MKLAYRMWGKEQFVNDELIKEDLRKMSQGKIDVSDEANIDSYKNVVTTTSNSQRRKPFKPGGQQQGQHGRRFQNNRNNNNKKKKRY